MAAAEWMSYVGHDHMVFHLTFLSLNGVGNPNCGRLSEDYL